MYTAGVTPRTLRLYTRNDFKSDENQLISHSELTASVLWDTFT